eukprot:3897395-Amphidinium_carterae.2
MIRRIGRIRQRRCRFRHIGMNLTQHGDAWCKIGLIWMHKYCRSALHSKSWCMVDVKQSNSRESECWKARSLQCGDFSGGRLWLADPVKGKYPSPKPTPKTQDLFGDFHCIKNRWFKFNPKAPHAVEESRGTRYSVVLFTPLACVRKLSVFHLRELESVGFPIGDAIQQKSRM